MRGLLIGAAIATLLSAPGLAAAPQAAGPGDPRIRIIDYDPWAVVRISGVFRTATQILLGEDETILHVAVGDATAWDVAAEKNILFVKPKAANGPTNLIVTTTHPGGERHYTFELTTRPANAKGAPETVFGLRFRYPAQIADAATAQLEARVLELKLDRGVVEGKRNLDYAVEGSAALQPSEVSDNGRFTVMRFPGNQPVPTIYQVESTGAESLVPFDVRGEFVVVHAVVRQLRLRRGREVLCIWNQAFEPYGSAAGTGTAASDVQRTEKGSQR